MLQAFTKRWTDESTSKEFTFTFYCDLCGKPWKSIPIPFSEGEGKKSLFKFLGLTNAQWKNEHKDAFERANREAMFHFNRCLVCKRWICDDDFHEDENSCILCWKEQKENNLTKKQGGI